MNSQDFLLILVLLIVLVLASTWFGRKPKPPTKLDLKAPDTEPLILPAEPSSKYAQFTKNDLLKELPGASSGMIGHKAGDAGKSVDSQSQRKVKNLNVLFNYNGHTWDAYEVLGVPAGADLSEVTKALHEELRKSDVESHDFLQTAYKAILDRRTL